MFGRDFDPQMIMIGHEPISIEGPPKSLDHVCYGRKKLFLVGSHPHDLLPYIGAIDENRLGLSEDKPARGKSRKKAAPCDEAASPDMMITGSDFK